MAVQMPERLFSGKVRDTYPGEEPGTLVVVASNRISTYDAVHPTPIPGKGIVLTRVSNHWLRTTPVSGIMPNHLIGPHPHLLPDWVKSEDDLLRRTTLVRRLNMLPVEVIVRGYLTGSGWKDYQRDGVVCGIELPAGMQEMEQFDEPIFTPSTKAEVGHDENVDFHFMVDRLLDGNRVLAEHLRQAGLDLYAAGAAYAFERGIILVDTKFEFGLDPETGELTLADEVLTPDSSRFVASEDYKLGQPPVSMDKQYVRDWASSTDWNKKPPAPEIPDDIVAGTIKRYGDVAERLTDTNPLV